MRNCIFCPLTLSVIFMVALRFIGTPIMSKLHIMVKTKRGEIRPLNISNTCHVIHFVVPNDGVTIPTSSKKAVGDDLVNTLPHRAARNAAPCSWYR